MLPLEIKLYRWSLAGDPQQVTRYASAVLSREETARIGQLSTRALQTRARLARLGVRACLAARLNCEPSDVPIITDVNGKPCLAGAVPPVRFNTAHAADTCVFAILVHALPEEDVGIDIERRSERLSLDETAGFLSSAERNAMAMDAVAVWVRKEAVSKCLGTGLLRDPRRIALTASSGAARGTGAHWLARVPECDRAIDTYDLNIDADHCAALATLTRRPLCILPLEELTLLARTGEHGGPARARPLQPEVDQRRAP